MLLNVDLASVLLGVRVFDGLGELDPPVRTFQLQELTQDRILWHRLPRQVRASSPPQLDLALAFATSLATVD